MLNEGFATLFCPNKPMMAWGLPRSLTFGPTHINTLLGTNKFILHLVGPYDFSIDMGVPAYCWTSLPSNQLLDLCFHLKITIRNDSAGAAAGIVLVPRRIWWCEGVWERTLRRSQHVC